MASEDRQQGLGGVPPASLNHRTNFHFFLSGTPSCIHAARDGRVAASNFEATKSQVGESECPAVDTTMMLNGTVNGGVMAKRSKQPLIEVVVRALMLVALLLPLPTFAQTSEAPGALGKPEPSSSDTPPNKTAPDLRGTKQVPLAVEVVHTEAEKAKERLAAEHEAKKAQEDHQLVLATWCLAVVTGALAVFTALLYWTTRRMAIDAKKISEASAGTAASAAAAAKKSAETAERALTVLERPIVNANVPAAGLRVAADGLYRGTLTLNVHNFGRTPAYLTRLQYTISAEPHGAIANAIDPRQIGGRELPNGTVVDRGDPFTESTDLRLWFIEDAEEIARGRKSVWLTGFARYDDIFGGHHITGFTLVFDRIGERFVRRGNEAYNYARREEEADIPPPSSNS